MTPHARLALGRRPETNAVRMGREGLVNQGAGRAPHEIGEFSKPYLEILAATKRNARFALRTRRQRFRPRFPLWLALRHRARHSLGPSRVVVVVPHRTTLLRTRKRNSRPIPTSQVIV
jgi:hypothetical protein